MRGIATLTAAESELSLLARVVLKHRVGMSLLWQAMSNFAVVKL